MSAVTTPARREDLAWVAPAARAARLIDGPQDLLELWAAAPWRVRVTRAGEAVLLARWRDHLDLLAVLGLWASEDRVPLLVHDLAAVAAEHGFARLLGPLVPEERAGPYLSAGLTVCQRVLVLRHQRPDRVSGGATPDGVVLRPPTPLDAPGILAVDRAAFDDFWRYDHASLQRYLRSERAFVAEREGRIIGYTLATVRSGDGSLGRLAVHPAHRGEGTGTALAVEATRWLAASGAGSVTLSTQEHNVVSRRLYRSIGFRELPGALVATVSGPLAAGGIG